MLSMDDGTWMARERKPDKAEWDKWGEFGEMKSSVSPIFLLGARESVKGKRISMTRHWVPRSGQSRILELLSFKNFACAIDCRSRASRCTRTSYHRKLGWNISCKTIVHESARWPGEFWRYGEPTR
jgi:hypothetical protein